MKRITKTIIKANKVMRTVKKVLALATVTTLAGLVLAGCGAESGRTFTVGFDAEFPPYGYRDESGEYTGFDLELAAEVCERNGWELVKQPIDWDSKDMELSSGSIDCIWNGFTINGREDDYTWSIPYVDSSQVIVVKTDSGIATFADLAGRPVGVQKDSSALSALEDNAELTDTFGELVQYADYNTAFMDMEAGAIDAVAVDIGVAERQLAARADIFMMLSDKLATEQYGIGFLKGNEELKDEVETALLEIVEDGIFMELAIKYGIEDSVCLGK
ncbi:MAG: amino acid ABC transporter substrate-binding protein [Lachnospiraceae bacterium]|jgi:polar amino acid transport system substrate-binding protein|nr:amino acid ABC transporter substrate-binding protein [Lachnospiraceae bacterium]